MTGGGIGGGMRLRDLREKAGVDCARIAGALRRLKERIGRASRWLASSARPLLYCLMSRPEPPSLVLRFRQLPTRSLRVN